MSWQPGEGMIALGIDPTDPRSKAGVCAFAVIEFPARKLVALGTLDRGRECDELDEVISRHHVEAVAVEVALDVYQDGRVKGAFGLDESHTARRRAITRALLWLGIGHGTAHVKRIESTDWHRALGVHLRRNPVTGEPSETYDAAVHRTIRMWLRNWPAESTAHERDAAGVCLGAFLGGA